MRKEKGSAAPAGRVGRYTARNPEEKKKTTFLSFNFFLYKTLERLRDFSGRHCSYADSRGRLSSSAEGSSRKYKETVECIGDDEDFGEKTGADERTGESYIVLSSWGCQIPRRLETLSLSRRPNALTKELSPAQRRRSETAKSNRIRIKITDYYYYRSRWLLRRLPVHFLRGISQNRIRRIYFRDH